MKMKLRVFVTMCGSGLVAALVVAGLVGVAEARPGKSSVKKAAQKSSKKLAARASTAKKKLSAEKKRAHAELVAKLKNEEQKSKEREANSRNSLESSILEKSSTFETAKDTTGRDVDRDVDRAVANTPVSIDFEEYPPFAEGFGWGD